MKENKIYLPNGEEISVQPKSDLSKNLADIKEISQRERRERRWKDEVVVRVKNYPLNWFFLMPLSDLHIGNHRVDYDKMQEYFDYLKNYPVYTVLLGDLGDFFIPSRHPSGMFEDVSVMKQVEAVQSLFEEYQDKILSIVNDPSHSDWIYQTSGVDIYEVLSRSYNIPLLESGGSFVLDFGNGVQYKMALFHKIAKFNSSLNPTHAGKRVIERHKKGIDFVVSGHRHRGSFEITPLFFGEKKAVIQTGTFKTDDTWGRKQGFVGAPDIFFPTILFRTDKKGFEIIEDIENSKDMIEALANYYKLTTQALLGFDKIK